MRLHGSVDIRAPAERVFGVLSTPERLPEWSVSVSSARRLRDEPIRVGSRAAMAGLLLGQTLHSETEVTIFQPPTLFATRGVRGPRVGTTFRLEPLPFGTRVTMDLEGDIPGGRLVERMAEGLLRRDFERSLQRLKGLCEAESRTAAASEPLQGGDSACWLGEVPHRADVQPSAGGNAPAPGAEARPQA